MVGDAGDQRSGAADLTSGLRAGYEAAAGCWAAGPERVYAPLAAALIGATATPVAGARVLDLGAGTGVAGRAALAAGARHVVAADVAAPMLRWCAPPLRPVAAGATALPFRSGSFDLVVAAFVVSHLVNLGAGLAEARRVGVGLAASAFRSGWTHPAKAAIDAILSESGYRPPPWYAAFKRETEARAGDPAHLAASARAAGLTGVRVQTVTVRTGVSAPEDIVSWRLGMAHIAPFVRSLDPPARARVRRAAAAAVAGCPPLTVPMLVLTSR
ncbi:MAG TPA: class I SAM-dependent methyltransferase [Streptosporangiaceae bacterium]|nr:class I SAM-dependent methyltransferase [Streptosporangiaceae bacterium]